MTIYLIFLLYLLKDDHKDVQTTYYIYIQMWKITIVCGLGALTTSLRCKNNLFEDITCGLEPLKTSLRYKDRLLEDIKKSKMLPPDPPAFLCTTLFKNIEHAAAKNSLIIHEFTMSAEFKQRRATSRKQIQTWS